MPAAFWHLVQFRGFQALQDLHPLLGPLSNCFFDNHSVPIYFLAWILRSESMGLWTLRTVVTYWVRWLGAAAAAYTGWLGSEGVMVAPSVRDHILIYHKWLMVTVLVLSAVLAGWAMPARPMPQKAVRYLCLGWSNDPRAGQGRGLWPRWMVFGYNAGGSLPQPIEFLRNELPFKETRRVYLSDAYWD